MKATEEAKKAADAVWIERIKQALTATDDHREKAAEKLGIARRTFFRRLSQLGLLDWHPPKDSPASKPKKRKPASRG